MKTICFVCLGNTCRSPMAEKILSKKLKNLNIINYQIMSVGICATGEDMSQNTKLVLKENGIRATSRKSKKLTPSLLKKKNIIFLTMTTDYKNLIPQGNVYSIAEFVNGQDINDPYGLPLDEYRKVFKQLDAYADIIANKIKKIVGEQK